VSVDTFARIFGLPVPGPDPAIGPLARVAALEAQVAAQAAEIARLTEELGRQPGPHGYPVGLIR
jgi:hypothetical protein